MRTLVIHPDDRSTDFLKAIYKDIPNCTVITKGAIWEVDLLIQSHDRVIMLGHGTPSGLLSVGQFRGGAYVIDAESAPLLMSKKDNIYIWCHASDYVKRHNLDGFSSGMFISEVSEARYCGIPNQTQEDVDIQCDYFCSLLSAVVNKPSKEIYKTVKKEYGVLAEHCKMADYNNKRLYYK